MPTVRQPSFNGGEVAPQLYGRTDHPLYGTSVRKMLNFIALPQGAVQNRPGTKFVASTKDPTQKAIQVPFIFSTTQTYVLEFGNLYIRFIQNGGQVVAGGIPYEIVSPFTTVMLPYLKWDQVGDVMTLDYGGQDSGAAAIAPQELRRLGHTNWTIGAASFAALVAAWGGIGVKLKPQAGAGALPDASHAGRQWWYTFTRLLRENATGNVIETAPTELGLSALPQYSGINTYAQGQIVSTGAGAKVYTSLQNANTGNLPSTSPTWWAEGIVVYPDKPFGVQWGDPAVAGYTALGVNVYRVHDGTPGWLSFVDATQLEFIDVGAAPDFSKQPPKSTNPFASPAGDYPSAVTFFEQRRIFARQAAHPARIQGSRIGQFSNFDVDLFVQADDAISFDLASSQLDEIRSLISLTSIVAFTQSGLWSIRGFQGQALGPTSINARKQQHAVGASWVNPARIGLAILYEQDGGGAIWDFNYDAFYDIGRTNDISVVASHFFEGHTIVRIVYSARPRKTIWMVRDDGLLIGCTYMRGSDPTQGAGVVAWHQHTTDGLVEDACVVPEGTEDVLYLLVKRTVNGATVRYHERQPTRLVTDARLGVFLDAALSFDGRNAGATTITVSGGAYNGGDEAPAAASAPLFVPDDVGSAIVLDPNASLLKADGKTLVGGPFRMTILAYTDSTHVTVKLDANLAAELQNVATTSWGFARRRFSSLGHLEGKTVAVLADGAVATAAKQDSSLIVTAGQITIDEPAVIVHAGLPYVSDLELLDLNTAKLNVKSITRAALEVVGSRGLWAGESFDNFDKFKKEWRQRGVKDAWGNLPLAAGIADVLIGASWNTGGRAVFRQIDPLPLTIVAAIREVVLGGN